MAPCRPTDNCPRTMKSRTLGIAPHTVISRILPASCRPRRGGGRIQDRSSALGYPNTSSRARLATAVCGNATRAELRGTRRDQRCLGWCVDVWVLIRVPLNSALVAFPHTAVASLARLDVFGYPSADERS